MARARSPRAAVTCYCGIYGGSVAYTIVRSMWKCDQFEASIRCYIPITILHKASSYQDMEFRNSEEYIRIGNRKGASPVCKPRRYALVILVTLYRRRAEVLGRST